MALLYKDQRFNSFEEFDAARVKYQEKNYVQWVIGNATTVQAANAEIVAKGGNNLFKPELRYRYAKFTCKFGGKVRIGTGKGKRPMQATHKIGCEARLELRATRTHLVIHSISEVHNHEVTEESYKALPENRNLSAEAEEKVKLLFNGGVKPAVVRSVLRGLTGNVTARDLANYRAKWKNQKNNGMTEKERLVDTLANLLDNDPDASVYVARDESDDLKFLFLQTSAMRRNVQMYGMVLLMDHSYKVNRNRMPVCVLMVMDGDGNGRSAGYAFVADEQQFTVSEVLTAFRESITEEVASKLTTIIIDKDPSEIAAIENVFPEVHIQLCSFHVSKTLKEKSVKESDRVKETLDNLKYVQSEEGYTSLCTELKKMASPTFVKYFEENWEKCPQAWSYRDKKHGLNFGNTTTNRVENHNSKIKMILNSNSTLADAVEGLLNVFLNKEEDVLHREIVSAMKRSYMTTALDDPIINQILADLKQYPANLLIWEFKQIPEEKEINDYEGSADVCYCPHMWMFKLPCRHMFQCRRVKGEQLYRPDEIASMWKKKKSAEIEPVPGASGLVKKKVLLNGVPAKPKDKYTASLETGKLISSLLSENGDRQYAERHSLLKSLLKMWSAGKEVVLLEKPEGADNNAYRVQPCVAVIVDTEVETFTAGENPEPKQKDTEDTSISEIPGPERKELQNTLNRSISNIEIITLDSDDESSFVDTIHIKTENNDFISMETVNSCSNVADDGAQRLTELLEVMGGIGTEKDIDMPSHENTSLVLEDVSIIFGTGANCDNDLVQQDDLPSHDNSVSPCLNNEGNTQDIQDDGLVSQNNMSSLFEDDNDCDLSLLADSLEQQDKSEPLKPSGPSGASDLSESNPLCWCFPKKPTIRLIAGPNAKSSFSGRPYYRCALKLCKFFQPAKRRPEEIPESARKLQSAFEGVNLPVVKPKGRPKGSRKTVSYKLKSDNPSKKEKPRGAMSTPFEIAMKGRQMRGSQIKDSDVTENSDGSWTVTSQSDKNVVYTVTTDTCTCPDWTQNSSVCKHMFKVRSVVSGNASVEAPAITVPDIENTSACCMCHLGEPSHFCDKCKRPVHSMDLCSKETGAGDGYGKPRRCLSCNVNSTSQTPRKRAYPDNVEVTGVAPPTTEAASPEAPQSQQSRFGRNIKKKKIFTPTKTT